MEILCRVYIQLRRKLFESTSGGGIIVFCSRKIQMAVWPSWQEKQMRHDLEEGVVFCPLLVNQLENHSKEPFSCPSPDPKRKKHLHLADCMCVGYASFLPDEEIHKGWAFLTSSNRLDGKKGNWQKPDKRTNPILSIRVTYTIQFKIYKKYCQHLV